MIQYNNFLMKREQSRAGSRFAECEKSRLKAKILITLALLLTAATGAWAQSLHSFYDLREEIGSGGDKTLIYDYYKYESGDPIEISESGVIDGNGAIIDMEGANISHVFYISADNVTIKNLSIINYTGTGDAIYFSRSGGSVYNIGYDVALNRVTTANTWTFTMPGSDVVLTPIYSEATITRGGDTPSETAYASLKEAFANLQDGDVIKLDWNVTLTEDLETPSDGGGVKFTLDFNGYTLDCGTTYKIKLKNAGDQLTFTDSSNDQLGGLIAKGFNYEDGSEFVFDAGRYNFNGATAETINGFCADSSIPLSLAEGKEFVDLKGGAAANDGFMVYVDYATIELTIGAGKFATFYAEQNVTVVEGTNISFYTIDAVDQAHTTATVAQYNSPVVPGNFPILVYNGSDNDQNVKLKVTTDPSTITAKMQSGAFQGTATDKTFTDTDMAANDYYVLSGGSAFAPVKGKGTIAAHKCWLEFTKNNGNARSITIVFDSEATGIRSMDNGQLIMDNWYDLNGRKLNAKPARKGVYIKNGQKVVVK